MRLYLIPASGLNSNVVTTGPGLICVMCPATSNSAHFCSMARAQSFRSASSIFSPRSAHLQQIGRAAACNWYF